MRLSSTPTESFNSLVDYLSWHASRNPDRVIYNYHESGKLVESITFRELDERAQAIAGFLQATYNEGDRIILIYPSGIDLICALMGCFYAKMIPVIVYPPINMMLVEKIQSIINDAAPVCILSTNKITKLYKKLYWIKKLRKAKPLVSLFSKSFANRFKLIDWSFESYRWHASDSIARMKSYEWKKTSINRDDTAFLQYTSGSTSDPKGVVVSHGNLLANVKLCANVSNATSNDSMFIWLPPYHDMGLIGGILQPIYANIETHFISPFEFLKSPLIWLELINRYRISLTVGPNFSFSYVARKLKDYDSKNLDLSCLKYIFNGAEPIHLDSINDFVNQLQSAGLNKNVMAPCYGLAEGTLIVSGTKCGEEIHKLDVSKRRLKENQINLTPENIDDTTTLVASGKPLVHLNIVDPEHHHALSDRQIGEIWLNGECVTHGYWQNEAATNSTFKAKIKNDKTNQYYLRTGDLGFLHEGYLYIVGRIKDVIIINGENYYPQDIEHTTTTANSNIRLGCCAAFSIEVEQSEKIVIVCEVEESKIKSLEDFKIIKQDIVKQVNLHHGLDVYETCLIKQKSIPKTTSGKIRRRETKRRYLSNELTRLYSDKSTPDVKLPTKTLTEPIDIAVRDLVSVAIGNKPVDLADNINTLGADSLALATILTSIKDEFGLSIDFNALQEFATLQELSDYIKQQLNSDDKNVSRSELIKHNITQAPLSNEQVQLWLNYKIHPKLSAYNIMVEITLKASLDQHRLHSAIMATLNRHKILRSRFYEINGKAYQTCDDTSDVKIIIIDITKDKQKASLDEIRRETYHELIDLTKAPLIATKLIIDHDKTSYLLFTLPHIVADGHSLNLFIDDLANNYAGNARDNNHLDYYDYCIWQQNQTTNIVHPERFSPILNIESNLLRLPYKSNIPSKRKYESKSHCITLSAELYDRLSNLANQIKVTRFALFLAAFKILLFKYTQQKQIMIGIPITTRPQRAFANTIGYFVNVLPSYVTIDPDEQFSQFAGNVKSCLFDLYDNKDNAWQTILSHLGADASHAATTQPQVYFVWQEKWKTQTKLDNTLANIEVYSLGAKAELTVDVHHTNNNIELIFEYDSDLFEDYVIKQLSQHYLTLLNQLITNPNVCINNVEIHDENDKRKLADWTGIGSISHAPTLLHEFLEATCKKTPNKTAISDDSVDLTYQELNDKSNQLARMILQQKMPHGSVIGVLLPRTADFIVASIAILKSGHICAPLDYSLPAERLQFIIDDSKMSCILLTSPQDKVISTITINKLFTTYVDTALSKEDLGLTNISEMPAYLIYTSGSTGIPKGVMLPHSSLCKRIDWFKTTVPLTSQDVYLHQIIFSFDPAIFSIWYPIACGASIVLPNLEELKDLQAIKNIIHQKSVTILNAVPTVLDELLNMIDLAQSTIRLIICGGEKLPNRILSRLSPYPAIEIYNVYGPTEACMYATLAHIDTTKPDQIVSIGKPADGSTIHLLNENLEQIPLYAIGEIFIGGDCLSLGYLNRPDESKRRFSNQLYRTGDLGRYLEDGRLEYCGRIDNQMKQHGYRVEPEEIEYRINAYQDVSESLVFQHISKKKHQSLIAIIQSDNDNIDPILLRNHLRRYLPDVIIPSEFIFVKKIPLLPSGKKDRKNIDNFVKLLKEKVHKLPTTTIEKKIYRLWVKRLQHEEFGIDTDFMSVGGNSLLSVMLVTDINERFNSSWPASALINYPTIRSQASALKNVMQASDLLIPLSTRPADHLIFCIHPIGGTIFCYQELARLIETNYQVIGIQSPTLSGISLTPYTIDNLIELYIDKIMKFANGKPFSLLGWSAGGIIAHGVANKLKQLNMIPHGVYLVDSQLIDIKAFIGNSNGVDLFKYFIEMFTVSAPGNLSKSLIQRYLTTNIQLDLCHSIEDILSQLNFKLAPDVINQINKITIEITRNLITDNVAPYDLRDLTELLASINLGTSFINLDHLQPYYNALRDNVLALANYQPTKYDNKIIYFKSTAPNAISSLPKWEQYVSAMQIIDINTEHGNMLQNKLSLEVISQVLSNR